MNSFFRSYCLGIFLFFTTEICAQEPFSNEQILADLSFLKSSLEEAHYNLYAYTSEADFEANYEQVKSSITKDSFNLLEATSLFQQVISKVNNGHTEIAFPAKSYKAYARAGGTLFPLEIAFENGKSLVRKNWSDDSSIGTGAEVLSINGLPMADILAKIYPLVSAERMYFKHAKIEVYSFPRYYWQVFGEQEGFEVEIRSERNIKKYSLKAVPLIEGFENKREEVLNAKMELQFYRKAAYLNPGSFSGDEKAYRQFIDAAFQKIKEEGSKNLIVDLRNNSGGDDAFSDYLVSYLARRPFRWNSEFTLKTSAFLKAHARQNSDTTTRFWQKALAGPDGSIYAYSFEKYEPQPKKRRFKGKVFVLVNRQSHSQSAVTAAQLQDYGLGKIVGEETGDYPSLYASVFRYPLPQTKVEVQVSKGYMVRVNGSKKSEGVIPDIFIKDHLLDGEDEVLKGILEQIGEE